MKKLFIALLVPLSVYSADTTITTTTTNQSTSQNTTNSNSTISYKDQPVQRSSAPTISVTNSDVCVSAVSGGAQTNVLGISMGVTVTDENCERIKLARELRSGGMKVASVAIMCQDARVFQAMIDSNTPCPFKGLIGDQAKEMWNKYPELRPDYQDYLAKKQILINAGYMDEDGNMIEKKDEKTNTKFKSGSHNWN